MKSGSAAFGRSTRAPATYALIAINAVVFLLEIVANKGAFSGSVAINDYGLFGPSVANGEWYRILTSGFLHYDPLHLLFNMYALYILGTLLEPAIGTGRFVSIYFASLFAGSLGVIVLSPLSLSAGASGAVFGLFAAAFVIARGRRLEGVAAQLGFLIIINLVLTLAIPFISIGAHLFGAIGGAVCALAVAAGERGKLGSQRLLAEYGVIAIVGVGSALGAVALA